PETLLALGQGQAAQVGAVALQAVEEGALHGNPGRRALDLSLIGQRHTRLKPLEARTAARVEGHDLPVDDEVFHTQGEEVPHEVGIAAGDDLAAAPVELDLGAAAYREH